MFKFKLAALVFAATAAHCIADQATPYVSSVYLPTAYVDSLWEGDIEIVEGRPFWLANDFKIVEGSLPPGIVMIGFVPPNDLNTADGAISLLGIPAVDGTFSFTLEITQVCILTGETTSTRQDFVITSVLKDPNQLRVKTYAVPDGAVNVPYGPVQLEATGGSPPYQWAAFGLPNVLQISPDGVLSGTMTLGGHQSFTVFVTDSAGVTANRLLDVSVSGDNSPYKITLTISSTVDTSAVIDPLIQAKANNPYLVPRQGTARIRVMATQNSIPVPGQTVNLHFAGVQSSGGHLHLSDSDLTSTIYPDLAKRITAPAGTTNNFPDISGTTGGDGVFSFTLDAGEVALDFYVSASSHTSIAGPNLLRIRLSNLQQLTSSDYFFDTSSHPGNGNYGTSDLLRLLARARSAAIDLTGVGNDAAFGYAAFGSCLAWFTPWRINGMTLEGGGIFDAYWNDKNHPKPLAPPHLSHRAGTDVDLATLKKGTGARMPIECRTVMDAAVEIASMGTDVKIAYIEPLKNPDDCVTNELTCDHWHVRIPDPASSGIFSPASSYSAAPAVTAKTIRAKRFGGVAEGSPAAAVNVKQQINGLLHYDYVLQNQMSSAVDRFWIPFSLPPVNASAPTGWINHTLGDDQGTYWRAMALDSNAPDTGGIAPSAAALAPGGSLGGFGFDSFLPPTLSSASTQSYVPLPQYQDEESLENDLDNLPSAFAQAQTFDTVAPANPADLEDLTLFQNYDFQQQFAFALGLITDQNLGQTLSAEVNSALIAAQNQQYASAIPILTTIMSQVSAARGSGVTDTFYQIVYYTAQYFANHWAASVSQTSLAVAPDSGTPDCLAAPASVSTVALERNKPLVWFNIADPIPGGIPRVDWLDSSGTLMRSYVGLPTTTGGQSCFFDILDPRLITVHVQPGTWTAKVYWSGAQLSAASFSVGSGQVPLTLTTTSMASGTVGQAYFQQVSATGGSGAYTWSVVAGALPGGLALTTSGAVSGTPSGAGAFTFSIQVSDAAGNIASQQLSLSVRGVAASPAAIREH